MAANATVRETAAGKSAAKIRDDGFCLSFLDSCPSQVEFESSLHHCFCKSVRSASSKEPSTVQDPRPAAVR